MYLLNTNQTTLEYVFVPYLDVVNISMPVWQKIGSQGNEWKNGRYYMDSVNDLPGYIVFEAIRGSGAYGDIAIDDITVTKGHCPQSEGW